MQDYRGRSIAFDVNDAASDYLHLNDNLSLSYIYPIVRKALTGHSKSINTVFEVGCGTGDLGQRLKEDGFSFLGIDQSHHGLHLARSKYPELRVKAASAYDPLDSRFGQWDAVVAIEVVEHLYRPSLFASRAYDLLRPGGLLVLSTPFHGYWKNLALALSGRLDSHFMALKDHGHIKFWSESTIETLLLRAGFHTISISFAGRLPPFSKSMVVSAVR